MSGSDSFFISLDFKKAYDSVNQDFLFLLLGQYGFPKAFIDLVKEIFRDAGSHIMLNGHKSRKIKLKSGIRQGCPSSRSFLPFKLIRY